MNLGVGRIQIHSLVGKMLCCKINVSSSSPYVGVGRREK